MKRGEIWWAELPQPVGNRPVVILTRDAVLENIGAIVVALVRPSPNGASMKLKELH